MTRSQRISLGILLTAQIIIGIVAAVAQPLWLGHEPDYFSVVRFLADNGRLPSRSDYEGAQRDADISQATQPPLFSYAALPLVALLDDGDPVPPGLHPGIVCEGAVSTIYPYVLTTEYNLPPGGTPAAGYSLRLLNLLFALGMTTFVYFATRLAAIRHTTALLAATFVAFQPQIFGLSVFISGESLLFLISSANLFFALRLLRADTLRPVDLAGTIITAILGPLTKTNGYVLIFATVALLAYLLLRHMVSNPRSRTTRLLLGGVVVLAIGIIAISIFNYTRYGSVIGRYQNVLSVAIYRLRDLDITNITSTLRDTNYDYTSSFPLQRQKLLWLYTLGGVFGLLLFAVHMIGAAIRRNTRQLIVGGLLLVYALTAFVLVLLRANLVSDLTPDKTHTPLRYYISGLPAMAVMLAIGWQSLVPQRWQRALSEWSRLIARREPWQWIGWAWALVWIVVVVWNIVPEVIEHPARSVFSAEKFEALANENSVTRVDNISAIPADVPHLRGYEIAAGEDGILRLTAYMQVAETPTLNYVARVAIDDSNGASTTCEIIPHDGIYPAPRWEPDQIVAVEMAIPNCAESGSALSGPLDITLDWLPADSSGKFLTQTASTAQHMVVNTDLPRAQTCLRNLGVFNSTFQVIQYNGPATATAGAVFLPSVNWYVREEIANGDLTRVYRMTDNTGGQSYTCEDVPRLGDHPIANWRRGEIVYFDQCAFRLLGHTPPGEYTVAIGLRDNATGDYLTPVPGEGRASGDGLLEIATISVEPPPIARTE